MRELGDNYARYHRFLATRLGELGGRPDPGDFEDFDDYGRVCTEVQNVLRAEAFLRQAWAFRQLGTPLRQGADPTLPLVDEHHRLVSAELGWATDAAPSVPGASDWTPPPFDSSNPFAATRADSSLLEN